MTALRPYSRARYFENHKLLSATDKLHRLYAATAQPIVWARSVGLEIVNELDTLKAAIMMSAGSAVAVSKGRAERGDGSKIADTTATAVEIAGGIYDTTKFANRLVKDIMSSGLNYLANAYGRR